MEIEERFSSMKARPLMKISFHAEGFALSEAIRLHADHCFTAALYRYEQRIKAVDVRLRDINGPRGGTDKTCDAVMSLRPTGSVIVKEADDDLYDAVSRAAHRLKSIMRQELQRRRERHRRP